MGNLVDPRPGNTCKNGMTKLRVHGGTCRGSEAHVCDVTNIIMRTKVLFVTLFEIFVGALAPSMLIFPFASEMSCYQPVLRSRGKILLF